MKILIVDDHQLFTAGLQILLQELCPGAIITTADSIGKVVCETGGYDLILLDFYMPGCNGLEGLSRVRLHCPAVPIVIISSDLDANTIRSCIDHGAMGFVAKSSRPAVLLKAMTAILAGETYLPAYCFTDLQYSSTAVPALQLSPRQKEVLARVVLGKPNKIIARELGISDQTVKSHVMAVLAALGVKNRTEAVYRSAVLGI